MKIVTSADSLNAVESMVRMIEEREWAEHVGVCPLTQRLETCITTMHNEIAQKTKECEKYELDNAQAVEFLSGQRDGLGDLCSEYRDEIWRLRDGINALLNVHKPESFDASTEQIMRELRDLATSKIEVCPPLQDQKVVGMSFPSVWDALIDNKEEREDLKERSRLMRVISSEIKRRYGAKEINWLVSNVGFSTSIWEALNKGHIDELEQDVLVQLADMLKINIIPGECELQEDTRDENHLAKIAHGWARSIVVHARAMNQTGVAERYMLTHFRKRFKITNEEWYMLEMMSRQMFMPEALPIPRLIQISRDGDVPLPVIELDD